MKVYKCNKSGIFKIQFIIIINLSLIVTNVALAYTVEEVINNMKAKSATINTLKCKSIFSIMDSKKTSIVILAGDIYYNSKGNFCVKYNEEKGNKTFTPHSIKFSVLNNEYYLYYDVYKLGVKLPSSSGEKKGREIIQNKIVESWKDSEKKILGEEIIDNERCTSLLVNSSRKYWISTNNWLILKIDEIGFKNEIEFKNIEINPVISNDLFVVKKEELKFYKEANLGDCPDCPK